MSARSLAFAVIAAVILGLVTWVSWTRRQENARLRSAAMHTCTEGLGDMATCAARVERDHTACRAMATTYRGKGQGSTLDSNTYADCITRGPDTLRAERRAMQKAQEGRRDSVLR